jgi:hypothetical protein
MLASGIAEGVAGNAIWTTAMGAAKRVIGRVIQITSPRPGELLQDPHSRWEMDRRTQSKVN